MEFLDVITLERQEWQQELWHQQLGVQAASFILNNMERNTH